MPVKCLWNSSLRHQILYCSLYHVADKKCYSDGIVNQIKHKQWEKCSILNLKAWANITKKAISFLFIYEIRTFRTFRRLAVTNYYHLIILSKDANRQKVPTITVTVYTRAQRKSSTRSNPRHTVNLNNTKEAFKQIITPSQSWYCWPKQMFCLTNGGPRSSRADCRRW